MPYVNSTAIRWIDYDAAARELYIIFRSGPRRYTYYNVPPEVYQAFLSAPSKGQFFHDHIEDRYSGP